MDIRLIVLRTPDQKKLADFYSLLGLTFEYHKHGNSPLHYSAMIGVTTLEIYPLTKSQVEPDKNLRLGFGIDDFNKMIEVLRQNQVIFTSEPLESDYGVMAVIQDPDGRKVEIYQK